MKNKLLLGIAVMFLLISIPTTTAIEINTFSDGNTSKNLTYYSPDSMIEYVSIYKYANISKAEWNLTLYNYTHYNDTEDSYSNDTFILNPENAVDENWGTYAEHNATDGTHYVYENFTIPSGTTSAVVTTYWEGFNQQNINCLNKSDSQWLVFGYVFGTRNNTALADCISSSPIQIRVPLRRYDPSILDYYYESSVTFYGDLAPTNPTNISIDTGNDGISDFINTTVFTTTETIDLNLTAIHNYLLACSEDSYNLCDVPFNIISNSSKILEISAINITYDEYDAITDCSGDNDATSLIFEHFHEESLDEINASLDITFEPTVYGNQSNNYSFAFSENHSHSICISPPWASYTSDAFGIYYSTTHSQRSYYVYNGTLTNTTQNIELYSLNSSDSDAVVIYIRDATGLFVEDVYIKVQRYYPGTGTYQTVAYLRTDEDGKDMTYLYLNDVYYTFILEQAGVVVNTISPRTITDTVDDPEEITFSLTGEDLDYYQYGSISVGCAWNNATFILRCTVSDSSNFMVESCLTTDRLGILAPENINETCSYDSAVTHVHNITNTTGDYKYVLTVSTPSNDYVAESGTINIPGTGSDFGDWGLMAMFLIVMVCGGLAMAYPPAGGIIAVIGLILGLAMNLYEIAGASIIGLLIVAFIYLWKGRSK